MDDQTNPQQSTQPQVEGSIKLNQQPPADQAQAQQTNDPLSPPPSDTPPPSDGRKIVRIALIIFSILFFITIAVLGIVAYQRNQTFVQNQPTPTPEQESPTPTLIPTNTPAASPSTYMNNAEGGQGMVYISDTLGIQFRYLPEQNNESIETYETETKVYIYPNTIEPQNGQWVEAYEKPANQPIEEAIKQRFLIGRSEEECFVEVLEGTDNDDSTITKLQISYPEVDFEQMIERMNYCAPDHARTNGIRYFWYDSDHPTTYLFFDIGQYAILAGENILWQDTIEIIE